VVQIGGIEENRGGINDSLWNDTPLVSTPWSQSEFHGPAP
jgi:hypothetical protein